MSQVLQNNGVQNLLLDSSGIATGGYATVLPTTLNNLASLTVPSAVSLNSLNFTGTIEDKIVKMAACLSVVTSSHGPFTSTQSGLKYSQERPEVEIQSIPAI